jgi:GT2 family glycosyltransferase
MRWWGNQRLRFPKSLKPGFVETWRFYTCNVSAKREFLLSHGGFDEAFPSAALEDTELSFRLNKHGLKLFFLPQALAYHHHPIDLDSACRQMEAVGRSADHFYHKTSHPGIPKSWWLASRGPWMTPALINPLKTLAERWQYRFSCPPLWLIVLTYSYLVGRGLKPER